MAEITITPVSVTEDQAIVFGELEGGGETKSQEFNMQTITRNLSKARVHLVEKHFWHGRTLTNYPDLPVGTEAHPRQRGTLPEGVKFGLVYADGFDTTARKFVVAFDSPAGKAYAEAGPVGPVDWNVVEVKLGMSGNKTDYTDHILGGRCIAELSGDNGIAIFRN